ncbi:HSP18 transcriptional regulator [Actinophytocola gossypii]|uniref:HSP18 transcriptional regulator n=1 Tax=Actinophytocola gossypii TaxID=2812003 RepID=A0ABT2J8T8_9PSEU|nr:HSP18 transcriptional regulator [Actinophytocola gossypii]MCT2584273.1 HSP18 transcriptional regulator [Actinophytocola gossypii]
MANTERDVPAARALALVEAVLGDVRGGGGSTPEDVLAGLEVLRRLREELAAWEPELITAAREHGASWARIAPALGVTSRQAAERRYLRLRPSATGEATGEERVRAERDKRAGDRAVARWARVNSASLRRLAGQVSAVEGLGTAGQATVDQVHQALAEDDANALLTPLADAHPHLRDTHSALADEISSLTRRTDQLRQDTRQRRDR